MGCHSCDYPVAASRLARHAGDGGDSVPARLGALRLDDAGGEATKPLMANVSRSRFCLGCLGQHSTDGACVQAGRLRLGDARLCRWVRRLHDLVWVIGWGLRSQTCTPKRNLSAYGYAMAGLSLWPTCLAFLSCLASSAGTLTRARPSLRNDVKNPSNPHPGCGALL